MKSHNSLSILNNPSRKTILSVPIHLLGGDGLKISEIISGLTPKLHKDWSSAWYRGRKLTKDSDMLTFNNVSNDIEHKGDRDRKGVAIFFVWDRLPQRIAEFESEIESDGSEGEVVKTISPSTIIDIWTKLEILLGLNLSGPTDIDEI